MSGYGTGGYGIDEGSDVAETRLSFVLGDKYQLRTDLSMLFVESQGGMAPTPFGPVPRPPRGPSGAMGQGPDAGQQGSAGGSAGGSSGQGSSTTSPSPPEAPDEVADEGWISGLGDLRVAGSRRMLGGGAKVYRLDASVGAKVPMADETEGLGSGEWDARIGLSGEYQYWQAKGFAGAGWNYLGDPAWVELKDVPDGYIGVESDPLGGRVIVSGWVEGNPEVIEGAGSRAALGVGLRTLGKARWRVSATVGLTDAARDFSLLVGASFGVITPTVGTRGPVR